MNKVPQLLDQYERPIVRAQAHEAAGYGRELGGWNPGQYSAYSEWTTGELEKSRDRLDDLIRNNGLASAAVQTHVDNLVGPGMLLNCRPNWRALGLKGDARADDRDEFEDTVESEFDLWAEDICRYVDASRKSRLSGLTAQGCRSFLGAFEIMASAEWLPRPNSKYATAIQMFDPRRVCNPMGRVDSDSLRSGIHVAPRTGEALGYHIASHLPNDPFFMGSGAMPEWQYVPAERDWGRENVIHVFDNDKPGRIRGKSGVLSGLLDHKMAEKWSRVAMEAAAFNASYVAYIESQLDWMSVSQAVGAGGSDVDPMQWYMNAKTDFHRQNTIYMNGLKIPHLLPGEKFSHTAPQHPVPSFEMFERAANRRLAAAWGLTYPQFSRDYSQSNYSSERAALLEVWRFFAGRQYHIIGWFLTRVYALWFEEAVANGHIMLPAGLPDFYAPGAKTAWLGCEWIGPGRGHIDILKEAEGEDLLHRRGLETYESRAAKQGRRWRTLFDQRAQEERYLRRIGMDPAALMGDGGKTPGYTSDDRPAPARERQQPEEQAA